MENTTESIAKSLGWACLSPPVKGYACMSARYPDFGNQARIPKISASKQQPAATLSGELHMLVFAVEMMPCLEWVSLATTRYPTSTTNRLSSLFFLPCLVTH
jgi:hypothetical protein